MDFGVLITLLLVFQGYIVFLMSVNVFISYVWDFDV